MSLCAYCKKELPPSKGNRPKKYCSKECTKADYSKQRTEDTNKKRERNGKKPWGQDQIERREVREQKKKELEKAIEEGWVYSRDVAGRLGVAESTVRQRARRLGIIPKKFSDGITRGKNSWKTYYSPSDFERIKNFAHEPKSGPPTRRAGKPVDYRTDLYRARNNEYRKRYYKNPAARMRRAVSVSVWGSLVKNKAAGKGGSVFDSLGYTPIQLKEHIEKQFDNKMSWDNYGTYWHIDHIVPQAALPYSSLLDENFRAVWELSNLRPLPAKENASKGSLWNGARHTYKK